MDMEGIGSVQPRFFNLPSCQGEEKTYAPEDGPGKSDAVTGKALRITTPGAPAATGSVLQAQTLRTQKAVVAHILLVNGPNLNLLGEREPSLYGTDTLPGLENRLKQQARSLGHEFDSFQSNHEGALIDRIQRARQDGTAFLLLNPGGYTHTSVALRDALAAARIPFIEVHISNIHAREPFRRQSYFSDLAVGTITGLGSQSYEFALLAADRYLNSHKA